MHAEEFLINHRGEQRGPYSIEQIKHLAKCKLIDATTSYWREGMEQWEPITRILPQKRRVFSGLAWRVVAITAGIISLLILVFGRVTLEGWRELTSSEFTEQGAWWRARGLVRNNLQKGERVEFLPFDPKEIQIHPDKHALVRLSGRLTPAKGQPEIATWEVKLRYDSERTDWSPWRPE
jgi:hypothetical protein